MELKRCRRRGVKLLVAGLAQAEFARQVGAARQTVGWERLRQQGGLDLVRRAERFGNPERLAVSQRKTLVLLLKAESLAGGFTMGLWTLPQIARF